MTQQACCFCLAKTVWRKPCGENRVAKTVWRKPCGENNVEKTLRIDQKSVFQIEFSKGILSRLACVGWADFSGYRNAQE
ncbi:hypothetical protein Mal48_27400 [Thalassoglobus polymorphus]|uniref:Uncharacterized protein n=1 Tax=Thalassoglobus polymorphus TaxID=2527994 RepID=A0A517QPH5_9PLAN|nr:hypothetical protein Mal48_27400 [Thalassoglobus polymorphus]